MHFRIKIYQYIFLAMLTILQLNLCTATWQNSTPLNTPRVGASAVVLGDYIYVMGGKTTGNVILNTVERFNPATGIWDNTSVPNFTYVRYNAAATVFQNKIYLTGGSDDTNTLDQVEVYDPVQNSWIEVQKLRKERAGHTAVVFNNLLFVLGGIRQSYYYENEIEWYDTLNNDWEKLDSGLVELRAAAFVTAYENQLYICGGEYFGAVANSSIADTNFNWTPGPSMQYGRHYGGIATANHHLYMIGGETSTGVSALVEVYDPYSFQISPGTNLPFPRSGLTAVSKNDTIYAIGGWSVNHFQILSTVTYLVPDPVFITPLGDEAPDRFVLLSGYPNPFNNTIKFKLEIPEPDNYQLSIYNTLGQKVSEIFNGRLQTGSHDFLWSAKTNTNDQIASGIYIVTLQGSKESKRLKIVYVR